MDIQVTISVQVPIKLTKRAKWYLASCPVLDVHSQGKTKEAARNNLGQAIQLFLVSCYERGTLDEVLKNSGFRPLHASEARKSPRVRNVISVPIPFSVTLSPEQAGCPA